MMDGIVGIESIFPSWRVKKPIGSGSYGNVYELERIEHDAVYRSAMKVISIPQNESEIKSRLAEGEDPHSITEYYNDVARNLLNENRVMAELKGNSNIVSYEDHQVVPHENGIGCDIFIRMELLTSFIDFMAENRITEDTVIRLGIDICRALEICENKNIIHRDIKPGNIFVSATGDFKLGDFGIARTIDRTTGGLSKKGTYRYMAPEVYRGEAYGRTVDIYSLGLVMYYLMNGNRTPFLPEAPTPVNFNDEENALLRRMNGERILPPKNAGNGLASIILKACAYDPAMRYQSASQMRGDLEALKAGNFRGVAGGNQDVTVGLWEQTQMPAGPAIPARPARPVTPVRPAVRSTPVAPVASAPSVRTAGKKNNKYMIAGISAAVTVLLFASIAFFVTRDGDGGQGASVQDATSTQTEEAGPVTVDHKGIEIENADIDWDSSANNETDEFYHTDIILYVYNGSSGPITGLEIDGQYMMGDQITNYDLDGEDSYIYVEGYIPQGKGGIMTGRINVTPEFGKKAKKDGGKGLNDWRLSPKGITVISAFTNNGIDPDYRVPTGRIVSFDKNKDTYDVELDNPNDMPINSTATLVAVSRDATEFLLDEADATGTLDEEIAPHEKGYLAVDAFYDPNIRVDMDEIIVYAIDTDYYYEAR